MIGPDEDGAGLGHPPEAGESPESGTLRALYAEGARFRRP